MAIALVAYEAPAITLEEFDELEVLPLAALAVVAAMLGVSIAFVSMVCQICGWRRCNSIWNAYTTVYSWMLPWVGC